MRWEGFKKNPGCLLLRLTLGASPEPPFGIVRYPFGESNTGVAAASCLGGLNYLTTLALRGSSLLFFHNNSLQIAAVFRTSCAQAVHFSAVLYLSLLVMAKGSCYVKRNCIVAPVRIIRSRTVANRLKPDGNRFFSSGMQLRSTSFLYARGRAATSS